MKTQFNLGITANLIANEVLDLDRDADKLLEEE